MQNICYCLFGNYVYSSKMVADPSIGCQNWIFTLKIIEDVFVEQPVIIFKRRGVKILQVKERKFIGSNKHQMPSIIL